MAGKPISKLNILIGASTQGLQRGLATAKSQIKGFQGQMERAVGPARFRAITDGWTKITAGIAIASATTAGLTLQFNEARMQLDEMSKSAQRTGLSLRNMAAISLAAEEAGASFEQARKAITDFQERLAKAQTGTGEYSLAFQRLGLDVKELMRLEPDRQLDEVTAALRRLDNQAERVQVIRALFGEGGEQAMLLLERIGKEGIAGLTEEIEDLGFVLNQQAATGVENMNDQFTRLNRSIDIFGQQLTAMVAPAITAKLTQINATLGLINRGIGTTANGIAYLLALGGMEKQAEATKKWADQMQRVNEETERYRGIAAHDIRTQAGISQVMRLLRRGEVAPETSRTRMAAGGAVSPSRGPVGMAGAGFMRGRSIAAAPRMTGGIGMVDPRNAFDVRPILQVLRQILDTLRGDRGNIVEVNRVSIPG